MLNIEKYIDGERVKREKIAMDIKYGVLSDSEINMLVSDKRIQKAFKGDKYTDKKPKSQWNQRYLDELSYGVAAEGFNEDYLLYLKEVSCYVNGNAGKRKKHKAIILAISVLIIIVVILLITSQSKNKSNNNASYNSSTVNVTTNP